MLKVDFAEFYEEEPVLFPPNIELFDGTTTEFSYQVFN